MVGSILPIVVVIVVIVVIALGARRDSEEQERQPRRKRREGPGRGIAPPFQEVQTYQPDVPFRAGWTNEAQRSP